MGWLGLVQGILLDLGVGVEVHLGGGGLFVTEPQGDVRRPIHSGQWAPVEWAEQIG